jgi:hypothetical protein
MTPHRANGGSAYRQQDGSHLPNKHSLFPYVLPAPPIPPLHDLIALITSGEEHTKFYEGYVNKKQRTSGRILKICVKWTAAKSHSTESWYLKRQTARLVSARLGSAAKQQLGYCLQVKPGPAPRNLPQRTLRRGQCAAKRRCGTKSGVRDCGSSKLNVQATTALLEFCILVETECFVDCGS